MAVLASEKDLTTLFKIPFERKKVIYSLSGDFFQNGNVACRIGEKQFAIHIDEEELLHQSLPQFPCGQRGCRELFTTVHDYEIHYRSTHSIECSECKKTFPSYNLLDLHIQEYHDAYTIAVKDKNLLAYKCVVDGCDIMFSCPEVRNEHVIKVHNYPVNFKFQQLKTDKKPEKMDTSCDEMHCDTNFKSKLHKSLPRNICFGRGSARAFVRKNKKSSSTDISMKELADAL